MIETVLNIFISVNMFFWGIVAAVMITGIMILTPIFISIGIYGGVKKFIK